MGASRNCASNVLLFCFPNRIPTKPPKKHTELLGGPNHARWPDSTISGWVSRSEKRVVFCFPNTDSAVLNKLSGGNEAAIPRAFGMSQISSRKKRTVSPEARKRMAEAQRTRRAKVQKAT
jgi:hypothetical protein